MDSDLAWVNGKSGRQSWCYADAFQRCIGLISGAIYHLPFYHTDSKRSRNFTALINISAAYSIENIPLHGIKTKQLIDCWNLSSITFVVVLYSYCCFCPEICDIYLRSNLRYLCQFFPAPHRHYFTIIPITLLRRVMFLVCLFVCLRKIYRKSFS